MRTVFLLSMWALLHSSSWAQTLPQSTDSTSFRTTNGRPTAERTHLSIETDPAFWVGTASNGPAFDANLNFRLASAPRWRFGLLTYTGTWTGSYARTLLLTPDFPEANWQVLWRGLGVETQYQFRFGMARGGLQPGVRLQWNQFNYQQQGTTLGTSNHLVVTPQVGFQWFPFRKLGLYILPWTGVQVPVGGTDKLLVNGTERATRQNIFVATAHIGWEFSF